MLLLVLLVLVDMLARLVIQELLVVGELSYAAFVQSMALLVTVSRP